MHLENWLSQIEYGFKISLNLNDRHAAYFVNHISWCESLIFPLLVKVCWLVEMSKGYLIAQFVKSMLTIYGQRSLIRHVIRLKLDVQDDIVILYYKVIAAAIQKIGTEPSKSHSSNNLDNHNFSHHFIQPPVWSS